LRDGDFDRGETGCIGAGPPTAPVAAVALEAGGWAVIIVRDLPDHVVVGKSVTLTYAVRQHGMHLLGNLTGKIEARAGTDVVHPAAAPAPATIR